MKKDLIKKVDSESELFVEEEEKEFFESNEPTKIEPPQEDDLEKEQSQIINK